MKTFIMSIMVVGLLSCTDDQSLNSIQRHFVEDQQLVDQITGVKGVGDSYTIHSIKRTNNILTIDVGYSGGCEEHDFQLVWNGSYENFNDRNLTTVALVHDANGDLCEAYPRQTLEFDLQEVFSNGIPTSGYDLLFVHAFSQDEYFLSEETMNITQGIECDLSASFEEVICGAGFFDNRWFRSTDDNLLTDHDLFYFQPVDYDLDDNPSLGNYSIGVRIVKEYTPDQNVAICQAYPGYSIPVKLLSLCPENGSD